MPLRLERLRSVSSSAPGLFDRLKGRERRIGTGNDALQDLGGLVPELSAGLGHRGGVAPVGAGDASAYGTTTRRVETRPETRYADACRPSR